MTPTLTAAPAGEATRPTPPAMNATAVTDGTIHLLETEGVIPARAAATLRPFFTAELLETVMALLSSLCRGWGTAFAVLRVAILIVFSPNSLRVLSGLPTGGIPGPYIADDQSTYPRDPHP